jgi:uncharacterized protein (TIGR03435 family)
MVRLAILALVALTVQAQSFEAASIKPSGPKSVRGSDGGPGTKSPERYAFGQATLQDLLAIAYSVEYSELSSNVPLDRDRFDIAVTIAPGASKEQFHSMMRNLLAERFHLKAHSESRELPGYVLVVTKNGPKLKEAQPETPLPAKGFPQLLAGKPAISTTFSVSNGQQVARTTARQVPVSALLRLVRVAMGKPAVDQTGLTGMYDFTLEYAVETGSIDPNAPPLNAPIFATAIQQQLGLQLVSKKLPFNVIMIDNVDRMPTEN